MGRHSVPTPGESPDGPSDDDHFDDHLDDDPYDGDPFDTDDSYDDDLGYETEDYPPTGEQPLYTQPPEQYRPQAGEPYAPSHEPPPSESDTTRFRSTPQGSTPQGSANRPPGATTGAHDFSGIDFQGGHRSAEGRRGVSLGVIIALVAVVVVVAGVIVWRFFGNALSDRTDAAAAACVDDKETVAVVVDPSITAPVEQLAEKFNQTATPVGDHCVAVEVKAADSDDVIDGFVGEWPASLGQRPALWIPASSIGSARLDSVAGNDTVTEARSLMTSPVLLAVRPELVPALAAQSWATLPGLQTNPTSLDAFNLPGWGSLRLALPRTGDSDASYLAAEAVAAAAAPSGAPPSAGTGAVSTLVAAQPKLDDDSTPAALDALLAPGDEADSPVHAVAITEQQLYTRAAQLPDATSTLASWLPPGPVAVADYPAVLLKGTWLTNEQQSAASEFSLFLRKPEQLAEFAKLGFQTEGGTPPDSDVVNFAAPADVLSVGDDGMRTTLANALTAPATGPSATLMLDLSMTTDEGGKSRLANVIAALNGRLGALPPNSALGLTTFNGSEGTTVVNTGPLADQVDGRARSDVLKADLEALSATNGGAVSFTTLRNVFTDAVTNFRPGQANSVLIITAGPHTDQSLDGAQLQETIRSAVDPTRPVAVNVINFGNDPDRSTWEGVAEITGGTYQNLASSASPELATALTAMLS